MNVRAALLLVLDQIDYTAHACAPTEMVGACLSKEVIEQARKALKEPFGLTVSQEPKYTVNDSGRIINRATWKPIPDDEPIMIFRAKDARARLPLRTYADNIVESGDRGHHKNVCFERYQQFVNFAEQHPERMKEPTS